jgi:hypothetical protein
VTPKLLVAMYERGAITGHALVVDCLNLVDPADPSSVLGNLPPRVLPPLKEFVEAYRPGEMLSLHGGPIPTPAQVAAARNWLESVKQPV